MRNFLYKEMLIGMDNKIMDSLAKLFKLLSDPNRIRILFAIGKDKKSVSEIITGHPGIMRTGIIAQAENWNHPWIY